SGGWRGHRRLDRRDGAPGGRRGLYTRVRTVKLATRDNGTSDGELLVVSDRGERALSAPGWPNLLTAITSWENAERDLGAIAALVAKGAGEPFDRGALRAPLPRTWQ